MSTGRRAAITALSMLAAILFLIVVALAILSSTGWGREKVRRAAVDRLEAAIDGAVEVGRAEGSLLDEIRLIDVSIVDSAGRPFVRADTLSTRYSLRGLLSKRIRLSDIRLVNAEIVLDRPPGEDWNFVRIFASDRVSESRPSAWGNWVELRDVTLVDSRVVLMTNWEPPPDLTAAQRREAIRRALKGATREHVIEVPGGYQNVMEVSDLNAELSRVLVAHPDTAAIPIDVERFSGLARPFNPPAADVRHLSGRFRLQGDTLHFRDVDARLPDSYVTGDGFYAMKHADLALELEGAPIAFDDLRWLYPPLPEKGGGSLEVDLRIRPFHRRFDAREIDLHLGETELRGKLDVVLGDSVRLHGVDLQFARFDTRLIERLVPDVSIPRDGLLSGRLVLDGSPEAMQVAGDIAFADFEGGTSHILANGEVGTRGRVRLEGLELRLEPLQTDLVRAFGPELPPSGTIEGRAHVTGIVGERLQLESDLVLRDPRSGVSRVAASGAISFGATARLDDLRMHFEPLQLELIRRYAPDVPARGAATGSLRVAGPLDGLLQVDGDLRITDPASGVSRVAGEGGIELQEDLRFENLDLHLHPLQTSLVRTAAPALPLGGTVEGTARLTGSPSTQLDLVADLVHVEGRERTHVTGSGRIRRARETQVDFDLRLHPISLHTVGRFAPEAGLYGSADGNVAVEGSLGDLRLDADLRFADAGTMAVKGSVDLASSEKGYDLRASLTDFDPSAISERVPVTTSLAGFVEVDGRGFDPATMRATLRADLEEGEVEGYPADEVHLRLGVNDGMAVFAPSNVRLRDADVDIEGSFGLVPGREGVLAYRISVDSLHTFAPWVPEADTGIVVPRPAVRRAALDAAEHAARAAEVEFLATGKLPEPRLDAETVVFTSVPGDSLAGRMDASGSLRGNVERFDVDGRVEADRFMYQGHFVERGEVQYAFHGVGTEELEATIDASFGTMLVSGYALDSATVRANYGGGRYGMGDVDLSIAMDAATELRLNSEFALSLGRNEIRLREMELRLDTLRWHSTGVATAGWGEGGVEVDGLDLRSEEGGRFYVDGHVPHDGPADLDIVVADFEIGHVSELLQEDRPASGKLTMEARLRGTAEHPRLEGEAALVDASFDRERVPDVSAVFRYANEELRAELEIVEGSLVIAEADVRLPIDLTFTGRGPALLQRPMQIEIRGDHIPLDVLPAFTDQVEAVEGGLSADFVIGGTPRNPELEGNVSLALESLVFVPLGIRFGPVVGHAGASEGVLRIDSLLAWSDGPTRITGNVILKSLTTPVFDLEVEAREAWVIDTEDARLQVDADLSVEGPLDALELTGIVRTRRGVIYVPELSEFGTAEIVNLDDPGILERADTLLLAQREFVMEKSEIVRNLNAEIDVEIDRDVWLRSTEANVEIYTPSDVGPLRVRMSGLHDTPRIEGTINTDRGEYEYLSRRFTLTRGAVSFLESEQIDPLIQVAAEHEVRLPGREAITIRIVLSGTIQDLNVILESNAQPPISQSDLLSFLAFGREASTLIQGQGSSISGQGTGGGGLVGNLAGLATQQFTAIALESMLSGLEADIGRDLGLDVLRITPANMPSDVFTGSYVDVLRGTEIEAGRYVGSQLFVAAQARPTTFPGIRLEYRTRRDFEWSASWRSRYVPAMPTLREPEADAVGVFGSFLFKEWRF